MQIAIVGLGRMGANMGRRLMRAKHEVVVYDLRSESVQALAKVGATERAIRGSCQEAFKMVHNGIEYGMMQSRSRL
jgi:6-phosphogluconate dehydrogenase (decarboxylating)